jgi:hypothetical protein
MDSSHRAPPAGQAFTSIVNQVDHAIDESEIANSRFSDIPADVIHRRQRCLTHPKLMQHF